MRNPAVVASVVATGAPVSARSGRIESPTPSPFRMQAPHARQLCEEVDW